MRKELNRRQAYHRIRPFNTAS